jgi:hypothetical protein
MQTAIIALAFPTLVDFAPAGRNGLSFNGVATCNGANLLMLPADGAQ